MKTPWRKHLPDVEAARKAAAEAKRAAEEARRAADAAKRKWLDVHRETKTNRELREANGWTQALTDIFGGRA